MLADLRGLSDGVWAMNSDIYQARANADEVEAANAGTENQRRRHEEAREKWQELADRAREFEVGQAERLADAGK